MTAAAAIRPHYIFSTEGFEFHDWQSEVLLHSHRRNGLGGKITRIVSGDAAWLPYARVTGADTHWLRIGTTFNGPTQEAGHGNGMQLEGVLSYVFENNVTLGIGARYWRMQVPHGTAHFEDSVIGGGAPQIEKMRIERYGMFVQLGYKY